MNAPVEAAVNPFVLSETRDGVRMVTMNRGERFNALSRGMQGLCIRLAKRLNALSNRRGAVFADRYHAHPLKTPRETKRAVRYVLTNYRHHALEYLPEGWTDPLASARFVGVHPSQDAAVVAPSVWLLRVGWRL